MKYPLIAALLVAVAGCATSQQLQDTPQKQAQTSDKIGPMSAQPLNVSVPVNINPGTPGTDGKMVGDVSVTVTVTQSQSQQGSTEQDAGQASTRGDTSSTPTNTTDIDATIPLAP